MHRCRNVFHVLANRSGHYEQMKDGAVAHSRGGAGFHNRARMSDIEEKHILPFFTNTAGALDKETLDKESTVWKPLELKL